jgi:dynein heavy chain
MVPQRVCVFQLPVIIDLRNPTLKPRHWAAIEQTVDATLVDLEVPLTLEKLAELHVFDFGQEIQDISGQASGEAALETILKKVNLKNVYSEGPEI